MVNGYNHSTAQQMKWKLKLDIILEWSEASWGVSLTSLGWGWDWEKRPCVFRCRAESSSCQFISYLHCNFHFLAFLPPALSVQFSPLLSARAQQTKQSSSCSCSCSHSPTDYNTTVWWWRELAGANQISPQYQVMATWWQRLRFPVNQYNIYWLTPVIEENIIDNMAWKIWVEVENKKCFED